MCFPFSVMKLATAVNLSTYTPVCLPASGKDFAGRISSSSFVYLFNESSPKNTVKKG
jgi:hypothetical protein